MPYFDNNFPLCSYHSNSDPSSSYIVQDLSKFKNYDFISFDRSEMLDFIENET